MFLIWLCFLLVSARSIQCSEQETVIKWVQPSIIYFSIYWLFLLFLKLPGADTGEWWRAGRDDPACYWGFSSTLLEPIFVVYVQPIFHLQLYFKLPSEFLFEFSHMDYVSVVRNHGWYDWHHCYCCHHRDLYFRWVNLYLAYISAFSVRFIYNRLHFYLYAVCLKGVYFGFFGYANDSTKNKLSYDYYDEEEEHLEELNRSTRSVVNALERMLREFGYFHDNLAL